MINDWTHLVTLPVNGRWEACYPAFQYENNTGDFYCGLRCYQVVSTYPTGDVIFHGAWETLEQAERFAASVGPNAYARGAESYWYAPAFGRLAADASIRPVG